MTKTLTGNRERTLIYLRERQPLPTTKQACEELGFGRGYFCRLLNELQEMGHLQIVGYQGKRQPLPVVFP